MGVRRRITGERTKPPDSAESQGFRGGLTGVAATKLNFVENAQAIPTTDSDSSSDWKTVESEETGYTRRPTIESFISKTSDSNTERDRISEDGAKYGTFERRFLSQS